MSFDNLKIPLSINTSKDDPIKVFFTPILQKAIKYDVGVGYFSTSWIRDAAEGIAWLAKNNGCARWIIGAELNKSDWEIMSKCSSSMDEYDYINKITEYSVEGLMQSLEENTRATLGWMIRDGIFDFRIAVPKNILQGIFHAKYGLFTDEAGNRIAFSGSYNMTGSANTNWEKIDIYTSMNHEESRINIIKNEFDDAWNNVDDNLTTYQPSDNVLKKFIKITEYVPRPYENADDNIRIYNPKIPKKYLDEENKLKKHQERAINEWFKNDGRGIFSMATGSGKTVTALSAITKLFNEIKNVESSLFVVISVPLKHLAEQWKEESLIFGFSPIMAFSDYSNWNNQLNLNLNELKFNETKIVFVITVNATFSGVKFQRAIENVRTNFIFVADEMHNLGASDAKAKLPSNANFRIGLSATPKRHMDEEGTNILYSYFGKEIIEYGIKEAIDDGALTPYYYHPILVEFTEDEMDQYIEISNSIARTYHQVNNKNFDDNELLSALLMKRSRLIAGAKNKLSELRTLLSSKVNETNILVYVGATSDDDSRQIEKVLRMIGSELGMRARKFTSEETQSERKEIIKDFTEGDLQAIVAIKCLDEGVDIPNTKTAFILASSTNPREFVQRRGRVLRLSYGKKFADIYDFVVIPPSIHNDVLNTEGFSIERKLFKRELKRINEFANVALNSGEALAQVRNIKQRLNLLDV